MGVFSDILASTKRLDINVPITALHKIAIREIDDIIARGDVAYPAGLLMGNSVHSLIDWATDPIGGTFTVTFTLDSGETFTTAAIAFNAVAATIETAIDVAATAASIVGWTNGDITVSGTSLLATQGPITLTFDGDSVKDQRHQLTTVNGAALFIDEVQSIAQHVPTVSGGTFELDFDVNGGETFSTARGHGRCAPATSTRSASGSAR